MNYRQYDLSPKWPNTTDYHSRNEKIERKFILFYSPWWRSTESLAQLFAFAVKNWRTIPSFPWRLLSWQHTRWRLPIEMLMNELRLLERQITNNQMRTLTLNVIFVLTLLRTRSLVSVGTYFGEKVGSLIFGFMVH